MSNRVLPSLFVLLIVRKLLANELIDLTEREPLHRRRLDSHADKRHVRIGRLLGIRIG